MLGSLPSHVVHHHELKERHVDEEHAHTVPHVHGVQVRHHGKGASETIGCCEKVEHGGHSNHDSRWHGIPLQPKRYEGTGDEDDAREEDGAEVERIVSAERQGNA